MTKGASHISLGVRGEILAGKFLVKRGYRIVSCNYKIKIGEIDIIAHEGGDLVFIEIKTRSSNLFGLPFEAVGRKKQRKIMRIAEFYLAENSCFESSVRFDVVSVLLARDGKIDIEVIKHAFEA